MSANDGTVDQDVFRVGLLAQHREQLGPDAFCRPPAEPAMNVAGVAVFLRKVTPGNSCPVSVQVKFTGRSTWRCPREGVAAGRWRLGLACVRRPERCPGGVWRW